ncbi:MAG: endonuclease/exonuclease/phosphatase family protein [Bacteroidales bacterium]|nr:endonuclease/exonuclease/phosphatase family protein [Bacteroidales bacterium]
MKLLRFILLIISLLFALLLIASTFAGLVRPSKFVGFSLLSYAYAPLLIANVVLAIIWLIMARWQCLLPIAAIVLRFSFLPLFFQIGGHDAPSTDDGIQLKVMTFNLHHFSGRDGSLPGDDGSQMFLDLVSKEQPEVLCLQEFFEPKGTNVAEHLRTMGYRFNRGYHNSHIGLVLFSKHPFVASKDIGSTGKFYADIKKNGHTVRLVCVHLTSYHLSNSDIASPDDNRKKVVNKSLGIVHKINNAVKLHEKEWHQFLQPVVEESKYPIIFMGDCNDIPSSYFYHQVTRHLKDSFCEQGSGIGTTYHGLFPAFRIDYIFHSPTLEALSYKRMKSDISDHYPLVAVFKIAD